MNEGDNKCWTRRGWQSGLTETVLVNRVTAPIVDVDEAVMPRGRYFSFVEKSTTFHIVNRAYGLISGVPMF
jgi:hypothetical protein